MANKASGGAGKKDPFSFVNIARRKRNQKIVFLVLTVVLGFGMVASSALWLLTPKPTPANNGQAAQQEAAPEQQIADLEAQLQARPQDLALRTQLAVAYWQAGRAKDAVAQYRKALEINPDDLQVRQALAMTYYLSGDYNAAVQQAGEVLKKDPQNALAHYYLGQFYAYRSDGKRDVKKGAAELEKYISLAKEGPEVDKAKQMLQELKPGAS
ncbi:MAG: tetratricopeptide repeat protein [Firmicutes bacterium]|nr:tetratricopeptide repeat protein [Bacillota bacterium]